MPSLGVSRPKILIVDDQAENLFALQKLLATLEVEVYQASSGNDALGLALEHEFAVAILDVQMPEMDGYELVELLRGNESTATLPIIFVSAVYSDEYHHRKGYDAGAVDFISKPFIPEILLSKIKIFVDLYQQRHQLQAVIGELNHANEQLQLSNKELQTLSYSVSHDLRAPLRAIDGYSRMLADAIGPEISPDALRLMSVVSDNVREMNELLEGLLKFSRLAFQPLAVREIEMRGIAQQVLDELLKKKERQIETSLADLPSTWADPTLMTQVFNNLLSNALEIQPQKRPSPNQDRGFRTRRAGGLLRAR